MGAVIMLKEHQASSEELVVKPPEHVDKELFQLGFKHGMQSNRLTNFKASFRAGFREAKLYIREQRRREGIIDMPTKVRLSVSFK